jgi:hypothetical protein
VGVAWPSRKRTGVSAAGFAEETTCFNLFTKISDIQPFPLEAK